MDWLGIHEAGITDFSVRDIIALSEHGVEVNWLKELRDVGLTDLSADRVIQLAEQGE